MHSNPILEIYYYIIVSSDQPKEGNPASWIYVINLDILQR